MLFHSSGFITRIFPNLRGHALRIIAPARRATPGNLALCRSSLARAPSLLSRSRSLLLSRAPTNGSHGRTHPCTESPTDDGPNPT